MGDLSRASDVCTGFAASWEASEQLGIKSESKNLPSETHGRKMWTYKPFAFLLWLMQLFSVSLL